LEERVEEALEEEELVELLRGGELGGGARADT
jgi:hypothetical protein